MEQYINEYLEKLAETKSEQTVKGHKSSLKTFFNNVAAEEPAEVLIKDVVNFRNEMYNEKKAGTVNTMLKRVKQFFDWCVESNYLDVSPAKEVKLLNEGELIPHWLDEKQEDLLIRAMQKKYQGSQAKKTSYREIAIVMLMLKAGLRVSEVSNLKWEEVQIVGDRGKALIRGKGQQQRTVPLIPDVVSILKKYKEVHGTKGEYVFFSQMSSQITTRMIQNIVQEFKTVKNKDVNLEEIHCHMLRHTFAHNLAVKGMAIEAIARVMGHIKNNGEPNIAMTIRYTKASESEIGDEMNKILGIS